MALAALTCLFQSVFINNMVLYVDCFTKVRTGIVSNSLYLTVAKFQTNMHNKY